MAINQLKLFMLLLGCRPAGRNIEQHDIFFGVALQIKELVPAIIDSWPEAKGLIHLDAWREVTRVGDYMVEVKPKSNNLTGDRKLFFINLGGYVKDEFEEYHYKMIVPAINKGEAVAAAKKTAFFKHTGFRGASAHVDDKYGIDVDELYEITDLLPEGVKSRYNIELTARIDAKQDELHLGYMKLDKL